MGFGTLTGRKCRREWYTRESQGPMTDGTEGLTQTFIEALVLLHPKGLRNRPPYLRFSFQELSQIGQDSAQTQLKRRLIESCNN